FTASARSRRIPDCGSGGRIFFASAMERVSSGPLQKEGTFLQRHKPALLEVRMALDHLTALELGATIGVGKKLVNLATRHGEGRPRHLRLLILEGDEEDGCLRRQQSFELLGVPLAQRARQRN